MRDDIILRFVGLNWLAESRTDRATKFLSKVRFALADKRYTGIYAIPNKKLRTFMTLAGQYNMKVHAAQL